MKTAKLPADFQYLPDMYEDGYFPDFLVDKIQGAIAAMVTDLEQGELNAEQIQDALDTMTMKINDLQDEFFENDSEIETAARESIGETVDRILKYFEIDMDIEDAIREREW